MGSIKETMLQVRENKEQLIADELEVPVEVLGACSYEIDPIVSDDGLVYSYAFKITHIPDELLDEWEGVLREEPIHLDSSLFEGDDYYFLYELQSISDNTEPFTQYHNEIIKLSTLMTIEVPQEGLQATLFKQIFIGVVGVMETYLSDTLMNNVFGNDKFFRQFVRTNRELSDRRFNLNEILEKYQQLELTVKETLLKVSYHHLHSVRCIYQDTFGMKFPPIKDMSGYVSMRHDLVHRNGKTVEGERITITQQLLDNLIECTNSLVDAVNSEMHKVLVELWNEEIPF